MSTVESREQTINAHMLLLSSLSPQYRFPAQGMVPPTVDGSFSLNYHN